MWPKHHKRSSLNCWTSTSLYLNREVQLLKRALCSAAILCKHNTSPSLSLLRPIQYACPSPPIGNQTAISMKEKSTTNTYHCNKGSRNEIPGFLDLGGGNGCTDMPESGWHFSMQPSYILRGRIPRLVSWEFGVVNLI